MIRPECDFWIERGCCPAWVAFLCIRTTTAIHRTLQRMAENLPAAFEEWTRQLERACAGIVKQREVPE